MLCANMQFDLFFAVAEPKEEPVHSQPYSDAKMPTQEVQPQAPASQEQPTPAAAY